jgi:hypothetical protein
MLLRHGAIELDRLEKDLDRVKDLLDRDHATLMRMMKQTKGMQDGIERRMLTIHYSLMAAWYRASRRVSPAAALRALDEMSTVLAYLANSLGEARASA